MTKDIDLDSATLSGVMRHVSEAESLPPWCYTSQDVYAIERDIIFGQCWVSVGRWDRWPTNGSYAALEVAGTPIVILRDDDGNLRCFANTCRHRGMLLLEQGEGQCSHITCPFHGWQYRLNGSLKVAPRMDGARNFNKDDYSLIEVPLVSRAGFVFVNLSGNADDIDKSLGDFERLHLPWSLSDLITAHRSEFEIRCNWKAFLEVFNEYYHIQKVHPRTVGMLYETPDPPENVQGNFTTQFGLHKNVGSVGILDDGTEPLPVMPGLRGRELLGTRYSWVYPSLTFAASVDAVWILEALPMSSDKTMGCLTLCFPEETAARDDFSERVNAYSKRMDVAIAEDIAVLERQQKGLTSTLARPGRFSPLLEPSVHAFQSWFAARLTES
ncbi:MAG: (2Fe-2S)-binding protein [Acidiferrobacteraceae bacterium]|nr:(2Fe-2S)-binding protein [Acidiferrobacteraceae bacterium]